jgi:hypothetical protein
MKHYILIFLLCLLATSCYRMPEEGEVSTVPNVNNPRYTGKNDGTINALPGVQY